MSDITITDADREAAANLYDRLHFIECGDPDCGHIFAIGIRRAEADDSIAVQAFARHRLAAVAEKDAEIERLKTAIKRQASAVRTLRASEETEINVLRRKVNEPSRSPTMKIEIQTDVPLSSTPDDMVGNVYPVRGGFGARNGHMHIIIAAYDKMIGCCRYNGYTTITVDRDGDIVGGNNYALHYFDSKVPMARCDGLDQIQLVIRSL